MNNAQQVQNEGQQAPYTSVNPAQSSVRRDYYQDDPRRKSPTLAAVLSMMPGLGQIYVGYYQLGFIHILVVGSLIAMLNAGIGGLEPLCGLFLAFFWLYSVVDAYRKASLYNQALAGLGPTELPEDVQLPSKHGSLLGGLLLIVFGIMALAHTKFGYSLDWLEDWWPAALVVIGGYLIYKSLSERKASADADES